MPSKWMANVYLLTWLYPILAISIETGCASPLGFLFIWLRAWWSRYRINKELLHWNQVKQLAYDQQHMKHIQILIMEFIGTQGTLDPIK